MAKYTKALYSGVGAMAIYDGTNLDEILAVISGISDMRIHIGNLYVNDEKILVGDAVCITDDVSPAPHAKIPAATLAADKWDIDAVVYDDNLDEVLAFIGLGSIVEYHDDNLYVNGEIVNGSDAVAKHRGHLV